MRRVQLVLLIVLLLDLLIVLRFAEAQPKLPRLGILLTGSPASTAQAPQLAALTKSLAERGWIDGQTLVVDGRWAERPDQLPGLAAELVQSNVSVILSPGPEATRAAAAATSTIPIVMIASTDPQQFGVASLARPGGNLTGLTIGQVEAFFDKRLELLKEAIPGLSRVVVMWDANRIRAGGDAAAVMVGPARALSLQLQHVDVRRVEDFEAAFNAARAGRAGAMLLVESPRAVANHTRIAELGLKNRLPLMSHFAQTVAAGGLMSYGPDLDDLFRRAAIYVDKILKGARPAELPIEQPTQYRLVLNMKTAKALGLTIPQSFRLRADQILE